MSSKAKPSEALVIQAGPLVTPQHKLIGICTVQQHELCPEIFDTYITDFVATKDKYSSIVEPADQTWFSACDPRAHPALVADIFWDHCGILEAFDKDVKVRADLLDHVQLTLMDHDLHPYPMVGPGVRKPTMVIIIGPEKRQEKLLRAIKDCLDPQGTYEGEMLPNAVKCIGIKSTQVSDVHPPHVSYEKWLNSTVRDTGAETKSTKEKSAVNPSLELYRQACLAADAKAINSSKSNNADPSGPRKVVDRQTGRPSMRETFANSGTGTQWADLTRQGVDNDYSSSSTVSKATIVPRRVDHPTARRDSRISAGWYTTWEEQRDLEQALKTSEAKPEFKMPRPGGHLPKFPPGYKPKDPNVDYFFDSWES